MDYSVGQIVASRAGRDTARWYVVVACGKDRVLLVDGKKFTLAAPKHKNPRHLNPTGTVLPAEALQTDRTIIEALAAYISTCQAKRTGG